MSSPIFRKFGSPDDTHFTVTFKGGCISFDAPFFLTNENAIARAKKCLPPILRDLRDPEVTRVSRRMPS